MAPRISLVLTGFSSLKRFADSLESISHPGFYQQLASDLVTGVHNKQVFAELGDRLVMLAEQSYAFRQLDALEQVSQLLLKLPRSLEYETVGRYYQALSVQRFGRGDIKQAVRTLEYVVENASPTYRAKAMQSLGTNSCYRGDYQSALSLYREAARFASRSNIYDAYATLGSQKMAAVINGLEGNHRGAVALLENLLPPAQSVRSSQPHVYYDYLNSLAVELCEVGRFEEARNISHIVVASPFACAYPEWRETREEIELNERRASRSTVAVGTPKVTGWRSEVSRQEAMGGRQKAEDREQEADARGHRSTNVVALSAARLDAPAITPRQEPASTTQRPRTQARVIKFPSSTSWTQEELSEKQMIVADMLWDMFQATIHDAPVDLGLIERLYKVFLNERRPA